MNGLEQAFYIMGIIYMAIMFIVMIGLAVAVFAIRAKINEIERHIAEKLAFVASIAGAGERILNVAKKVVHSHKP